VDFVAHTRTAFRAMAARIAAVSVVSACSGLALRLMLMQLMMFL
jgi:hypothetical protein